MGLVFEVDSDQELRERMESGKVISCIRDYFEELKAEGELPFASEQLTRDNATDFVEVSSFETSIDYHTFAEHRPSKLVQDFRELILLAYDQVFAPVPESPAEFLMVFNCMYESYVEDMEKLVQRVEDHPATPYYKDVCYEEARCFQARICGVVSYLYISRTIKKGDYDRMSDDIWSIYESARNRIREVRDGRQ